MKSVFVIIMVGIAVVLGYAIYNQQNNPNIVSTSTPVLTPSVSMKSPSADKDFLLSINANSSDADKKKHYDLAVSMAKESMYLEGTNCAFDPFVLKVKDGAAIKVKNNDSHPTTITFNDKLKFTVSANSTKEFQATLGHGPGLYGYGCESNSGAKGFILVVPK